MSQYNTELVNDMIALCEPASRKTNDELYSLVAAGDKGAIDKMIETNMSLVVTRVDNYLRLNPQLTHLRDDMIAEGFLGLTHSVNKMAKRGLVEKPNATGFISYEIRHRINKVAASDSPGSYGTQWKNKVNGGTLPVRVPFPKGFDKPDGPNLQAYIGAKDVIAACCYSEEDRIIMDMRVKKYTFAEIAKTLNMPESTVYQMSREIDDRIRRKGADD